MPKDKYHRTKPGRSRPKSNRTPFLLIAIGAVVVLITLFFVFQPSPATGGTSGGSPRLKADKEQVDLGDVALGTPVKVSFQLTNTGGSTLNFKEAPYTEVKEGC